MIPEMWRTSLFSRKVLLCYGITTTIALLMLLSTSNFIRSTFLPGSQKKIKYILYWTPVYGSPDFYFGFGREPFLKHDCPVSECYTTNNRLLLPVSDFDVIVFSSVDYKPQDRPKPGKQPHQKYVFHAIESVINNPFDFPSYSNFFDITMTYRHDSDILLPNGHVSKRNFSFTNAKMPKLESKSKFCAWFVSNCRTRGNREAVFSELQRYIEVDVYGECGSKKCPVVDNELCDEMLHEYKFYLAFENSLCPDYVTEKFYRALRYDVIPVVYGGANYSKFAPPHSYIDVRNFTSVKSLADYLTVLSEDEVKYSEYFEWKRDYYIDDNRKGVHPFCKLCELLHDTNKMKASTPDVKHWWLEENKCENPDDVFKRLEINSTVRGYFVEYFID